MPTHLPHELSELFTPRGRRYLRGQSDGRLGEDGQPPFVALSGLIARSRAEALRRLLDRELLPHLSPIEDAIPAWTVRAMQQNYAELLPKTFRARTALFQSSRSRAFRAAEKLGLVSMLRSESFRQLAERISGRALRKRWGIQVLCYGPGDYAGPHNDHHPEDAEARDGYLDVHLTLSGPGVASQLLIYERDGHLSEVEDVNTVGGLTAYRLPFWHYTTPLVAKKGREDEARRWVLLGTFLFTTPRAAPKR